MKKLAFAMMTSALIMTSCGGSKTGDNALSPSMACDSAWLNVTVVDYNPDREEGNYIAALATTYDEDGEIQPTKLSDDGKASFGFDLQGDIIISFDQGIRGSLRLAPGDNVEMIVYPDSIEIKGGRFEKLNKLSDYQTKHGFSFFQPDFMRYDMNGDEFTEALIKMYNEEKAAIEADTDLTDEERLIENATLLGSTIWAAGDRKMLARCSFVRTNDFSKFSYDSLKTDMSEANYRAVVNAIDPNDEAMMMAYFPAVPSVAGNVDWNKYGAEGTLLGNLSTYVKAAKSAYVDNVDPEVLAKLEALPNPFFATAVKSISAAAKARNDEAAKLVSAVPDVEFAEIIPAIAAKHPGKVVVFDVWNTWCGPCKAAIAANEPLKKTEYNDPDIVFVYLADDSSPVNNYYQIIPNISGEHYRLSADQAKEAYGRYNLDGFPFYLIVDRQGNIEAHPDFRDHEVYSKVVKEKLAQK